MRIVYGMVMLAIAARSADANVVLIQTRCGVLARADQVFVGRVDGVATLAPAQFEVTFTILDTLRGTLATPVVHMAGTQGASCAPLLVPGNELLVVGYNGHATCANARRRADAADEIAFVRGFGKRAVGYVAGTVALYDNPYESMSTTPRAGVEIRVPHTAFSTRTAADGSYRLEVPPGRYTVQLVEPDPKLAQSWYPPDDGPIQVYQSECTTRDFGEVWNGRIRGRLVDHQGKPAGSVRVHAIEESRQLPLGGSGFTYGPNTLTDFDGYYELGPVPAGKFVVAVSVPFDARVPIPGTFYPGVATRAAARLVRLGRGDLVSGIDFRLRAPRPMTEVTAVVAERPARRSVVVRLTNLAEQRVTEYGTSTGGEATLSEEIGARATLQVCVTDRPVTCGPPVTFVVAPTRRRIPVEAP
jgi:hypothetical protein